MRNMTTLLNLISALPNLFLGVGSIGSLELFAQSSSSNYSSPAVSNRFRDGSTNGSLRLLRTSFDSLDYHLNSQRDFQYLLVDIRPNKKADMSSGVRLGADLSGLVTPNNQVLNYLNIRELFLEHEQLSLGRKKMSYPLTFWGSGFHSIAAMGRLRH